MKRILTEKDFRIETAWQDGKHLWSKVYRKIEISPFGIKLFKYWTAYTAYQGGVEHGEMKEKKYNTISEADLGAKKWMSILNHMRKKGKVIIMKTDLVETYEK